MSTEGEYLKVVSEYEGGRELVAKAQIMARYACDESVAIGDGMSDLSIALSSTVVFARDSLMRHLEAKGMPYVPWEDFFQVRDLLARRWMAGPPLGSPMNAG